MGPYEDGTFVVVREPFMFSLGSALRKKKRGFMDLLGKVIFYSQDSLSRSSGGRSDAVAPGMRCGITCSATVPVQRSSIYLPYIKNRP